jgi:hypothetical protein
MAGVFQIINPSPPISVTARRACTPHPAFVRGEDTLARGRGGWGSIFWKTSDTALYSTYISTLWNIVMEESHSFLSLDPAPPFPTSADIATMDPTLPLSLTLSSLCLPMLANGWGGGGVRRADPNHTTVKKCGILPFLMFYG